MSQVGKPIEKATLKPEVSPIPKKVEAPAPVETPQEEKVPA